MLHYSFLSVAFLCIVGTAIFPLSMHVFSYYDLYAQGGVTCMRRAVLLVCAGRCYIFALCGTPDGVSVQRYQPVRVTSGVTCPVRSGISGNSDFQSIRPYINAYEVKISLINAYSSV